MMRLREMIERWRRYAGHVESNPGQLTPAKVYEICADELEVQLRLHLEREEAMRQSRLIAAQSATPEPETEMVTP
jgi:hypothetical protein